MAATTEEEVWDDADLMDTWNEAFAEYKKYHSLASAGGKAAPVPASASQDEQKPTATVNGTSTAAEQAQAMPMDDPPAPALDSDDYAPPSVGQASKSGLSNDDGAEAYVPSTSASAAGLGMGPGMPNVLAGMVQDESLKQLMMSWYYAGYYTGLYEGKQQGFASATQQQGQGG